MWVEHYKFVTEKNSVDNIFVHMIIGGLCWQINGDMLMIVGIIWRYSGGTQIIFEGHLSSIWGINDTI